MPDAHRTARTYRFERWRALSAGVIETAGTTFLLLIAVRHYEAGAFAKALVAAGGSGGLLIAPWLVAQVQSMRWPVSVAAARLASVGAITFLLMALVPVLPLFVIGSVVAMTT